MRKIINGRLYDTNTANEIGSWHNNCGAGDYLVRSETLYQKKTGEYFLYGRGGAMTRYASRDESGCLTGGEMIIPLSGKKAMRWAEDKLSVDKYLDLFGAEE